MRHIIGLGLALLLAACATRGGEPAVDMARADSALPAGGVIVIAHRGASGERPEHTLEAYRLAIAQGADFIEPDLVMTRDGVLVARHDPWLSDSTDVATRPEFAGRRRTVISPDGAPVNDWWAWDFTLAELRTLKATQTRDGRDRRYDGQYDIPTFAEIIALAGAEGDRRGRVVGLYPETKWPIEHLAMGLVMEDALVTALEAAGLTGADAPVYVQSFEPTILQRLDKRIDTPLVQLVYPIGWTADGALSVSLEVLAAYADGVGPYKAIVIDPQTGAPTGYARAARELGLEVHPWTFRDDDRPAWAATPEDEIRAVIEAGATGFFTDFPATGVRAAGR